MQSEPAIDSAATATLVVDSNDLASALPLEARDAFPAVFATSRMVALMEIASARLLHAQLGPGEMSVGVSVDVIHSAPTPEHSAVTAAARYLGRAGKLFEFEVVATDAGGEIGRARHKRAITNVDRLQDAARRRTAAAREANELTKEGQPQGTSVNAESSAAARR